MTLDSGGAVAVAVSVGLGGAYVTVAALEALS